MINAVIEADGNSFNSMNFVEEEEKRTRLIKVLCEP